MQTKTTHIQQRRNAAHQLMHDIMQCIGITELEYCYRMYGAGRAYLYYYIGSGDTRKFEESKEFWNWWKIQWAIREEEFMTYVLKHPQPMRYYLWTKLHDAHALSQERNPNGMALGEGWCVMVAKVHKEHRYKDDPVKWAEHYMTGRKGAE